MALVFRIIKIKTLSLRFLSGSIVSTVFMFVRITFLIFISSSEVQANPATSDIVKLRYSPHCILEALLKYRNVDYRPDIELPHIYFESQSSLEQLNSAIFPLQWSTPAAGFSNAFAFKGGHNEIFLIDNADYYKRHGRFIDDSLAHELFHFLQIRYANMDITGDDFAEFGAIVVQSWFRDTYMKDPDLPKNAPCPDGIVK